MPPKPKPPAKRTGPGRPWKNTPGSKPRTFRVTEDEYAMLAAYLERVRAGRPPKRGAEK
jgi:hypothetical protein